MDRRNFLTKDFSRKKGENCNGYYNESLKTWEYGNVAKEIVFEEKRRERYDFYIEKDGRIKQ